MSLSVAFACVPSTAHRAAANVSWMVEGVGPADPWCRSTHRVVLCPRASLVAPGLTVLREAIDRAVGTNRRVQTNATRTPSRFFVVGKRFGHRSRMADRQRS